MDFKIGYKVRPKTITDINEVIFERWQIYEGSEQLVEVAPTESECIGYGFNYNNSKCWSLSENSFLDFNQVYNYGSNNRTSFNNSQSILLGNDNNIEQGVDKSLIVGEQNKIELNTKNGIAVGTGAEVTANNSVVLGGNDTDTGTGRLGAEIIQNGNFDEIGTENILNGDFSDIGTENVLNGDFSEEGIDKVDNGDFATNSDWIGVGSNGWSIDTVTQSLNFTNASNYVYQGISTVQNKTYKVVVDLELTSGALVVKSFNAQTIIQTNTTGRQTLTGYFTEADTNANFGFQGNGGTVSGKIYNVSVNEVGQNWAFGTGWSIGDGYVESDGTNSPLDQYNVLEIGKQYKVVITVLGMTASPLSVRLGASSSDQVLSITSDGTYTAYGEAGSATLRLRSLGFNGKVTNVSVKEVGQDWTIEDVWTIGNSVANGNGANGSSQQLVQSSVTTIGKIYKVSYKILNYVSGSLFLPNVGSIQSGNGIYTEYITATQTELKVTGINFNGSITNISVKEVGQDWALTAGWSIGNSKAVRADESGNTQIYQYIPVVNGRNYKFSYTRNYVSGNGRTNIYVKLDNINYTTLGTYVSTVVEEHTVTGTFTAGFTGSMIWNVYGIGDFTGNITNISVIEVLPDIAPKQNIRLMYGVQSTNGSTINSYLNSITDSAFIVPDNTALYFHADVLAVRVGGIDRSGAIGDFLSWVERGVVINKSGTLSIERERDTIKGSGQHTNWRPTAAVDGNKFYITVRGDADMIIEWAATINFTQIKTLVEL